MGKALKRTVVCERTAPAPDAEGGKLRVDADKGIIYGAKVLGYVSANKRRYSRQVMERRFKVYEGAQVFDDHAYGKKSRPNRELAGVIRNAVMAADGVRGDVHCLKESPAGRRLLELAMKCPDKVGLSPMHAIDVEVGADGWQDVTDITECISVDYVTKPATNKSLFEAAMTEQERQELEESGGSALDVTGGPAGDDDTAELKVEESEQSAITALEAKVAELEVRLDCAVKGYQPTGKQLTELLAVESDQRDEVIRGHLAAKRARPAAASQGPGRPKSVTPKQPEPVIAHEGASLELDPDASREDVAKFMRKIREA